MATSEFTIAEMLKKVNYTTGIFGKWHLGDNYPSRPSDQGFAESLIHLAGGIGQVGAFTNYFKMETSYFDPLLWHNNKQKAYKGYCSDIFTQNAITTRGRAFEAMRKSHLNARSALGMEVPRDIRDLSVVFPRGTLQHDGRVQTIASVTRGRLSNMPRAEALGIMRNIIDTMNTNEENAANPFSELLSDAVSDIQLMGNNTPNGVNSARRRLDVVGGRYDLIRNLTPEQLLQVLTRTLR